MSVAATAWSVLLFFEKKKKSSVFLKNAAGRSYNF